MPDRKTADLRTGYRALVARRLSEDSDCYFLGFEVSRYGLAVNENARRVIDMPISEETVLGIAVGMSRTGCEVFVDLMFEAFSYRTMDVLINQTALTSLIPARRRRLVTVRMLSGPFAFAGPQHGGIGYALLARLPGISVAAPCMAEDIEMAYEFANRRSYPVLLLLIKEGISTLNVKTEIKKGPLRIFGKGRKLGIICFGLHASLVIRLVEKINAFNEIRILVPLFLSPLPTDQILDNALDVENLLIVEGSKPPATVSDLIIANALRRKTWAKVVQYSLSQDQASDDGESVIFDLAESVFEVMGKRFDL
jgi:pyruvate/2-oxoglutarate/acetoin dehydrogenase E1 component